MKTFTIRPGFSFVMPDGEVKGGGDTIDLPDDVAEQHRHKFEPDPEPEPEPDLKLQAPKNTAPKKGSTVEAIAATDVGDLAAVLGVSEAGAADPGAGGTTDPV